MDADRDFAALADGGNVMCRSVRPAELNYQHEIALAKPVAP
jgi:hypothetical protein